MGQDLLLHQNVLFVMPLAKNAQKAQCGNLRIFHPIKFLREIN